MGWRHLINFASFQFGVREQRLTFANISPSSSYSHKEVSLEHLTLKMFSLYIFKISIVLILFSMSGYCKHLQEEGRKWWQESVPSWVVADCSGGAWCDLNVLHSNYISIEWSAREWILEPCHKPLFTMWAKLLFLFAYILCG